jgi:hypothetical protein
MEQNIITTLDGIDTSKVEEKCNDDVMTRTLTLMMMIKWTSADNDYHKPQCQKTILVISHLGITISHCLKGLTFRQYTQID